ncbi:MAG: hypothetical protein MMC23_008226 [Stictis urceolatum]|nr:hypothetical protein [Stictis urceolata]
MSDPADPSSFPQSASSSTGPLCNPTSADPPPNPSSNDPSATAKAFLASLLNRQLLIHTSDSRMFAGEFKCTDNEQNIILSRAYEYRLPSARAKADAAAETEISGSTADTLKVDMTSRFMGLIVVPGQHITKIELEEYEMG